MNEEYILAAASSIMQLEQPTYGLIVIKGAPHRVFDVRDRGAVLIYEIDEIYRGYSVPFYSLPCGVHHEVPFFMELSSVARAYGDTPLTRAAQVLGEIYGDTEPWVIPAHGQPFFRCPTA